MKSFCNISITFLLFLDGTILPSEPYIYVFITRYSKQYSLIDKIHKITRDIE